MPYWKPYVPVAKRRAKAAKKVKQLQKKGKLIEPVEITGRKIARTFWGEAWCDHLESFSDYENRLPRGRTYVRNGSVCHLGIGEGKIEAIVSGSELYDIEIDIKPLPAAKWKTLQAQCRGQIGSLLELLQGQFSDQVMAIVTDREQGLFPKPNEIQMQCNCPDWADLCKHLAAVLYGVGARLDQRPELLFKLRGVDHQALISADVDLTQTTAGSGSRRRLATDNLGDVFGIELDGGSPAPVRRPTTKKTSRKPRKAVAPIATNTPPSEFTPTPAAIIQLRQRLGLNKTQFARLVGVSASTVTNWEKAAGELRLHRRPLQVLREVSGLTPEQAKKRLGR